ncbi:unnamed protein product [Calypogeia fissa]
MSSESALATLILSSHIETPKDTANECCYPPTIILPPSFETVINKRRSLDNILIGDTKVIDISSENSINGLAQRKSPHEIKVGSDCGEPVQSSNKKRGLDKILIQEDDIVPDVPSKSNKDDLNKKKSPKGASLAHGMGQQLVKSSALEGTSSQKDQQGENADICDDNIGLLTLATTPSLSDAPRKLKPEEMAVLYSDSPDPSHEPDPNLINISQFESNFIKYMVVDWATDWKYSQTGENDDDKPLPSPIAKSQSEQFWENMKILKTWAEGQTLINQYTGNVASPVASSEDLQEVIKKMV